MRLLYIWIKQDENEFLKDINCNFTKEYEFNYDKASKKLTCSTKSGMKVPNDFFKIGKVNNVDEVNNVNMVNNVDMVNAIVGANGAGKTTLLKHIFEANGISLEFDYYNFLTTIQIFEVDGKIFIYNNVVDIENVDELINELNNGEDIFIFGENCARSKLMFKWYDSELSKIYLSNSSFDWFAGNLYPPQTIHKIAFTEYDLNIIAQGFFGIAKLTEISSGCKDDFRSFNSEIMSGKDRPVSHYLEGLMFLKFYIDCVKKDESNVVGGFYNHLSISSANTISETIEIIDKIINKTKENKENEEKEWKLNAIKVCFVNIGYQKSVILNLYYSLLFEILVTFNEILTIEEINDSLIKLDEVENVINSLLSNISGKIDNCIGYKMYAYSTPNKVMEQYKNYYSHALGILKELKKDNEFNSENVDVNKLTADTLNLLSKEIENNKIVSSPNNEKVDEDDGRPGFILKYIFVGSYLSSGERALYRLMSWLYSCVYADVFLNFKKVLTKPLGENILLLIDEIDLYMHPEWQRQILYQLINSLNTFFKDKHFHLIYSSHSPITLSDMPSQYVIKLKDGKFVENNEQTFCSNIYDLLHDSFFLGNNANEDENNYIGVFATKKINSLIENLRKIYAKVYLNEEITEEEKTSAINSKEMVNLIGDVLIKNKLLEMISIIEKKYNTQGGEK